MSPGLRISPGSSVLRHLEAAGLRLRRSLERLTGGSRIARAADDPAGLGVSERMRARLLSQRMAGRNAAAGVDLARAAGAVLGAGSALLERLAELAVRAPNGTLAPADLAILGVEWALLVDELERVLGTPLPGGSPLAGPGAGVVVALQVGPDAGQVVQLSLPDLTAVPARLRRVNPGLSGPAGKRALEVVRRSVERLALERARLASGERRLERAGRSLAAAGLQLAAAESRVRDADLAGELAELVAARLVLESATGLAVQANREGTLVLELLAAVPPPWTPEEHAGGAEEGRAHGEGSGADRAGANGARDGRPGVARGDDEGPGGLGGRDERRAGGRFSRAKAPLLRGPYG